MTCRTSTPIALLVLAAAACGDESSDTTSSTTTGSTTTGGENQAPEWVDAPEGAVSLGEGQTLELAADLQDADGDAIEVSFVAPAGLEIGVDEERTRLTLHAGYGIAGAHEVDVTLGDGETTSTVKLAIEVKPLAWLEKATWTEAEGPEAREHGALLFVPDAAGGRFVVFAGTGYSPYGEAFADAWAYSVGAASWTPLAVEGDVPSAAGSRRVAPAGEPGVAYLFGGYSETGATNRELYRVTVTGSALAFEELQQNNPPPRRALHAFARDPVSGRLVVFGGFGTGLLADTWVGTVEGSTATWTKVETTSAPSPRYGFFYGFDDASRRLILWSGAQGTNPLDPAGDAWALDMTVDPPVWSLLLDGAAPGAPPGRRNGCFVFDPSGPRLAVFGGTADAATSEPGLWMLDVRPGKERWDRVELAGEPDVRSSGFGGQGAGGRLWMGFGNTAQAVFRDFSALGYAE